MNIQLAVGTIKIHKKITKLLQDPNKTNNRRVSSPITPPNNQTYSPSDSYDGIY